MIQDMKKLTFLVTNKEYDQFIADIRDLGVIHVEELQQGATSDELQAGLDLAERYKNALKALDFAAESYESSTTYTPLPADASKGVALVDTVERLLAEENSVKHSIDATDEAIAQLEPFGEFSWDTVRQLEATGYKPYFYAVNNKLYKAEWGEKYYATPVSELDLLRGVLERGYRAGNHSGTSVPARRFSVRLSGETQDARRATCQHPRTTLASERR